MNLAGRMFLITKEQKYADFVTELPARRVRRQISNVWLHVQKNTNPTGRLFHQILNEHCWLMFSSLAYSCVASTLTQKQRDNIESRILNQC